MALADAADRDAALVDFEHNLVITAGAGTGKTSLLTSRVLCALLGQGLASDELLVTTFTEKAAAEMAVRIESALIEIAESHWQPESAAGRAMAKIRGKKKAVATARAMLDGDDLPKIGTFHTFCLRTLRDFAREAGLPPDVQVAEDEDIEHEFDVFFQRFLSLELGEPRVTPVVLSEDEWRTILNNPGLEEIRRILHAYCMLSLPEPLEWEDCFGAMRAQAQRLHDACVGLVERVGAVQANAFKDRMPGCIEVLKALSGIESADQIDDHLLDACRQVVSQRPPGPTKKTPEHEVRGFKDNVRAAWKLIASVPFVPRHGELGVLQKLAEDVAVRFADHKARAGLLSYQDCLSRCYRLLGDERVRGQLHARYHQILVDEFQDTDPLQYDILFRLTQTEPGGTELRAGSLCIVGDPKQSIYRFRGADMTAFEDAVARILANHGRRLSLTVNFRSERSILTFVNSIMTPCVVAEPGIQPPYEMLRSPEDASLFDGISAELLYLPPSGRAVERKPKEARILAAEVAEYMAASDGRRYADVAFLFRSFTDVDLYARELRQAGIPALVDGGRRFYERHEVERFVSLLRALLRPWDEAALLAFLRSPLAAVPDAELLAYAEAGGRLSALSTERGELHPAMAAARDLLARLGTRVRELEPHEALRYVLHESRLAALEAAGYDGPQRLANLEKLITMVSSWCVDGAVSLEDAVERLGREADALKEMEESPLADPELNAVRLLTVHKAKGLEFDFVIVPDFGWSFGTRPSTDAFELWPTETGEQLLYRFGSVQAPSIALADQRNERHERAENLRILYVALTRAKKQLLISHAQPAWRTIEQLPWGRALVELGFAPEDLTEDGACVANVLEARLASESITLRKVEAEDAVDPATLPARVDAWASARARSNELTRATPKAPSAEADEETPSEARAVRTARGLAMTIGKCVHGYLLAADFSATDIDEAMLTEVATNHAAADGIESATVLEASRELLARFLSSDLRARLASCEIVGRELPMFYADDDGNRWHGAIDLVFRDGDTLTIADFKTDRVETDLVTHAERYRSQLGHYARATQRAWRLDALPRMELLFLWPGQSVVLE